MPDLQSGPAALLLVALVSYALGAVPFGMVMARIFGLGDLRQIGSGNIGATNVLRTGNRVAALFTLLGDAGKGAAAVLLARAAVGDDAAQIAGGAAFLGHVFPVWLGFRGGKGVATWLGTLLALAWPVGLAACAIWLAVAAPTRFSSLAALVSAGLIPPVMMLLGHSSMVGLGVFLAALIVLRHYGNIRRLLSGTETRIGRKG